MVEEKINSLKYSNRKMKKLFICLLLGLGATGCSGTYDLVYNQPVERMTTTINYQTGIYGFGYYDAYGRFYGPNYINYYGPRPLYGPRIVIKPRSRTRVSRSATPRGSSGVSRGRSGGTVRPRGGGSGGGKNTQKVIITEPSGAELFFQRCAVCHVNGALGAPKPKDMKLLLDVVKNGRNSMPRFTNLSDSEIESIFNYIKKLK